ncbi:hypothetical protein RB593_009123 [Gaeumannomyces tritici]
MLPTYVTLALGTTFLAGLVLGAGVVVSHLESPLRVIPGPFLAGLADTWRMLNYWRHLQIRSRQALHQKETLLSEFYSISDAIHNGIRITNPFSTFGNSFHRMRPYQKYFTSSAAFQKERHVNSMAVALCRKLEARFVNCLDNGKPANLAD